MATVEILSECLRKINCLSEDVVTLLDGSQEIIDTVIGSTKNLADFSSSNRSGAVHVQQHEGKEQKGLWEGGCGPKKFHIQGFDSEQIWQEIELGNEPILRIIGSKIDSFSKKGPPNFATQDKSLSKNATVKSKKLSNKLTVQKEKKNAHDDKRKFKNNSEANDILESEEDEVRSAESLDFDHDESRGNAKTPRKIAKKSIVDDSFFVLDDMNRFLDEEDKKESRNYDIGNDEDDSDGVDYFAEDILDDDESEDDNTDAFDKVIKSTSAAVGRLSSNQKKKESKNARMMMYGDFFDQPTIGENAVSKQAATKGHNAEQDGDSEDINNVGDGFDDGSDNSDENDEGESASENEHAVIETEGGDVEESDVGSHDDSDDDSDDDQNDMDLDDGDVGKAKEDEAKKNMSRFEKESVKMKEKIVALEEDNIAEKPWQLVGEATAAKRPKNSLLAEDLSFEQTLISAPQITEEVTETLEEMIKQRIKDQAWDDVMRKVKPVEKPFEYKKSLALDQEKSKLSLAEVYEKEYIKKTKEDKEEETNPGHEVIQNMMDKLFAKLDALSNFQYTPKQPKPELKVVSNLPSVEIEEFTPVTVSNENMLAPEEIYDKKKSDIKGQDEKSVTDRKRERREKKIRKKEIVKKKERKLQERKSRGINVKENKEEAIRRLKKSSRNTQIVKEDDELKKTLKSSSAFFSQLQENIEKRVDKERQKTKKRKENVERAEGYKL
ncbi:U3 small nucleolar ribonucleoprotein protein MPP10-like [Rhopilema esculentum]|uniref:U3 small nucleolar ribonucleoprotein protein MPP10-like n=1 Tax=Rhopilema esculentum TaxID=499914 RepID=UPI0031DC2DC0